jgi:hypothetical protein
MPSAGYFEYMRRTALGIPITDSPNHLMEIYHAALTRGVVGLSTVLENNPIDTDAQSLGHDVEDERRAFAAMLGGRRPTAQELCEHEATLLQISKDRGSNKSNELLRREAMYRPTPYHPECRGGATVHINGPDSEAEYARGSVEWAQQQRESDHDV